MPTAPLLTAEADADDLERAIARLDTLYEAGEPCVHPADSKVVTDAQYDGMRRRLKELRPDSPLFATVTASEMEHTGRKVKHDPPMTSIEKANGSVPEKEATRTQWLRDIDGQIPPGPGTRIVQAFKVDGVACSIVYRNGKLHSAGLRPRDGINGEDVTENIRHVTGVPHELPEPIDVTVRGELYCPKSVFAAKNKAFEEAGEKTFANPRNYTTGSIRQFKNPAVTATRGIHFMAYAILGQKNPSYHTEYDRAVYCAKKLGIPHVRVKPHAKEDLDRLEVLAPGLDYEVDGVVLSVNNLEDQQQMGSHGGAPDANPRGKIAWKFAEEHAHCLVKGIVWNTGRSRKVTPVANFDGAQLAGTNVVNCTLHSLGFMRRMQIGLGTTIEVIKSGKIIPFAQATVSGHKPDPEYPATCPSCGRATEAVENSPDRSSPGYTAELFCTNQECDSSAVGGLVHFLTVLGVKGLGESTVETLYATGTVKDWPDFYNLTDRDLEIAGFSERETVLIQCRVRMRDQPEQEKDSEKLRAWHAQASQQKIKLPLWQVFASLGIPGAGKSTGRALADKFKTFAGITAATLEELEAVEGVGRVTAVTVFEFLRDNCAAIDRLLNYIDPEGPKDGLLTGKTFCFSGSFEKGKEYFEKKITALGGTVATGVSKKVNYFVAGPGSGSKSDKAKLLHVPVMTVNDLKAFGVE